MFKGGTEVISFHYQTKDGTQISHDHHLDPSTLGALYHTLGISLESHLPSFPDLRSNSIDNTNIETPTSVASTMFPAS